MTATNQLNEKNNLANELIYLTEAQIKILKISDKDIESDNLIPHDNVNKNDLDWLNTIAFADSSSKNERILNDGLLPIIPKE